MKLAVAVLIATLSLPAWAQNTAPQNTAPQNRPLEEIVAWVNNDVILRSELERAQRELRDALTEQGLQGTQLEQAYNQQAQHVLRDLIDQNLLMQVARDAGLSADVEVVKFMDQLRTENNIPTMEELERAIVQQGYDLEDFKQNIRTRYLTQQVIGREVSSRVIITEEEVRAYYEAHKQDFDRPEGVQLSEIVVSTEGVQGDTLAAKRKKIDDALAAIRAGGDFAETARQFSEANTAQDGGVLGFFQKGQLAPELESATASLAKGQTSEVLTMPYGFVILRIDDKHSGGILSFELAREEVQNIIFNERLQPKIREYLTKLRMEGSVRTRDGYVDSGAVPAESAQK